MHMSAFIKLLNFARPDLQPIQDTAKTGRLKVGETLSGLNYVTERGLQFFHEKEGLGHWVVASNIDDAFAVDIPAFFCSLNKNPSREVRQQLFDVYRPRFSPDTMLVRRYSVSPQTGMLCGYCAFAYAVDLNVFKRTYDDVAQAVYDL